MVSFFFFVIFAGCRDWFASAWGPAITCVRSLTVPYARPLLSCDSAPVNVGFPADFNSNKFAKAAPCSPRDKRQPSLYCKWWASASSPSWPMSWSSLTVFSATKSLSGSNSLGSPSSTYDFLVFSWPGCSTSQQKPWSAGRIVCSHAHTVQYTCLYCGIRPARSISPQCVALFNF